MVEALLVSALEVAEAASDASPGVLGEDIPLPPSPSLMGGLSSGAIGLDPMPLLGLEEATKIALSKLCMLLCQEVGCGTVGVL